MSIIILFSLLFTLAVAKSMKDFVSARFNQLNHKFVGGQPTKVTGTSPLGINELSQITGGRKVMPGPAIRNVSVAVAPSRNQVQTGGQQFNPYSNVTPQAKMIQVNQQLGNSNISSQQGTTRVIFDSLPIDGRVLFNFFQDVQTRVFPLTNLSQNKLNPMETMTITQMYFSIMTVNLATGVVTGVAPLATAFPGLYASNFSINIATTQVLKPTPLTAFQAIFNPDSHFANNDVFTFKSDLVIPPLLEFTAPLQAPVTAAVANTFLQCTIVGNGSLLSPKFAY